jgi:hypothetical protein
MKWGGLDPASSVTTSEGEGLMCLLPLKLRKNSKGRAHQSTPADQEQGFVLFAKYN